MIQAERGAFVELESGAVQFSVTVRLQDRAKLMAMFGDSAAGGGLCLSLPCQQNPAPQVVAALGAEHGSVGNAAPAEQIEARKLCDSPVFQAFARSSVEEPGEADDLKHAIRFMSARLAPAGGWDEESPARLERVLGEYRTWSAEKGYL